MSGTAATDWSAVAAAWEENADSVESHTTEATEALLANVDVRAGDRVLELAAGPGALTRTWSRLVGPEGSVVVSDVAPGMVEAARRRAEGLANVELAVLDLTAIDRPDASFDVVACRMGLMFAPDPAVALAEMRRVLRSGGRLGVLTWAGIEHNPWMTCVGMAAAANGLVNGGPPVGPGGIFSLGDPSRLEVLTKEAGFEDVTVEAFDSAFRAESVDAHVDSVGVLAGPLATAFASATPEQLAAVRATATTLAAPYTTATGVSLPARALLLTARV